MLRPQDNGIRETKSLDGIWSFVTDPQGVGRDERWWSAPLADTRTIAVPASYNDLFTDRDVHDHVGEVWYQRTIHPPASWADGRVVLRFDSATQRASVWVEDTHVVDHEGGYLPFEADITELAAGGGPLRVTVAVDNVLTFESIPPGTVEVHDDGTRKQRYFHDFFNYAGLHRSVWLHHTPTTHIDDLTVVTDIDDGAGVVHAETTVANGDAEVRLRLTDADGRVVAEGEGTSCELRVEDPELWGPGRGYLYELCVELVADDTVVDRFLQPVGIRTVRVDGSRFLVNGEPVHFTGFGMHEDHEVRGKGHDPASMVHDFELLRWTGANSFRTSHYPYAEEVLDHADRLGLLVIDETAAVGLNLGVVGGFFGGPNNETFTEETIGSAAKANHLHSLEELITRDKNHPSVVMWCVANEPESNTDAAREYFEPVFETARAADPSRPVGFVNMLLAPAGTCKVAELSDVIMINRYYGWYIDGDDLEKAEHGLEDELRQWAEDGKPIMITEYGADTMPGLHGLEPEMWNEEFQVELLDMYHRVFDRIPEVVGEHVWNFADFATTPSIIRVGGNKKGVFTRNRKPKAAAHLLRERWAGITRR